MPPLTVRDGIGYGVDGAMDPLSYVLPFFRDRLVMKLGNLVNDRSLNLDLFQGFEETTVDLYSAVRNGYLQRRYNLIKGSAVIGPRGRRRRPSTSGGRLTRPQPPSGGGVPRSHALIAAVPGPKRPQSASRGAFLLAEPARITLLGPGEVRLRLVSASFAFSARMPARAVGVEPREKLVGGDGDGTRADRRAPHLAVVGDDGAALRDRQAGQHAIGALARAGEDDAHAGRAPTRPPPPAPSKTTVN